MRATPGRLVLLGHPLGHSRSALMQNAALRVAGVALRYEPLDVEPADLDRVLTVLATQNAAGNVTIPHKEAIAERCARLESIAARCGAVNTFWHEDGQLVGDNTDVGGFDRAVGQLLGHPPSGARVALIGAGGAAAAVLCAADRWPGSAVRIYNRHMTRAEELCGRFATISTVATDPMDAIRDATIVVNATPVGMHDEQQPVDIELVPADAAVIDLVYRAGGTAWVRAARAAGNPACDGFEMLLEQGALAFERWFGIAPDREAMRRAMA